LRKSLVVALAGVLVLGIAGIAFASTQFTQTADIKFTTPKTGTPAGVSADLEAADPGEPGGKPKSSLKVVVNFPRGTKYDTTVPGVCKADDQTIQQTNGSACPANSKVGTGSAVANAAPAASTVGENITAYNAKNQIIFLLTPADPLGQTFVLRGKLSGNKLTTIVPQFNVAGIKVVLTVFKLKTKVVKKSGKSYLTTAKKCNKPKKFETVTNFTYDDGTTQSVVSDTPCRA
jgi:hypothetical protein